MNVATKVSIRKNIVLRLFAIPIINLKLKLQLKQYAKSEDSKYIKTLKNLCKDERCFIIGNGPSLCAEDLELLKNEKCFAFNRIYCMYPKTTWRPWVYMCVDKDVIAQLKKARNLVIKGKYVFFNDNDLAEKYRKENAHRIFLYNKRPLRKYMPHPLVIQEDISSSSSNTYSVVVNAFEVAVYMGFKEIYLLGVDHNYPINVDRNGRKTVDKNIHSHFKEDKDQSMHLCFIDALENAYETCKVYAEQHGIKIVNVTRGGKLEIFERDSLENVLYRRAHK